MAINTIWSVPTTAGGSGGIDLATGDTLSETVWDRIVSNTYRLGGTDGNSKTGPYYIGTNTGTFVNNANGLTVNQGAADDEALTIKSTDVAHGMTSISDTDSYGTFRKQVATEGGLRVIGLRSANATALDLSGTGVTADTTHTTSSNCIVTIRGSIKSGTSNADVGTNGCVAGVINNGTTEFIIDADGDMFNNGASGTSTTYDDEDDAALLETLTSWMNPKREGSYKYRLARDLEAHKAALAAGGVVTLNPDGSLSMISYKGMLGLLVDAIRQVTHAHRTLEARVAPLLST